MAGRSPKTKPPKLGDSFPPREVLVEVRRDLYLMLVSSLRYAMGRQTYIVGDTCSIIRKYWRYLDKGMKEVLLRDLNGELRRCEESNHFLGADFDHREWVSLRDDMTRKFDEEYRDGEG